MVGRYFERHQTTGFNIYVNLLAYILGGETFCHLEYIMLFLNWDNSTFKYILFLYYAYTVQIKIQYKEKALCTGSQRAIFNSHSSTCSHLLHNCSIMSEFTLWLYMQYAIAASIQWLSLGAVYLFCIYSKCNEILHNNRVAFIIHKVHVNIALQ